MIGKEIGPYRITGKIGQGGMGIVFKGFHVKLEQEVAIKVLAPEFSQDPGMRDRFIHEAKIQAKISHPNVVNVFNYVEEDGNLFLVMEYIRGDTLENRLKRDGRLPNAAAVCISMLSALDFMHARGIIHRDIKPGNIMFLEDGSVKVMDFGIAKVAGEKGQTKTGMRLGTLWYMSPEQIRGEEASVSSDLYSVGVTLYQMATGRIPFGGDSEYKVMKAHLEEKPVPPWDLDPSISRDLGRIILKAIAKERKDRYQSARDFAADLGALEAPGAAPANVSRAAPERSGIDWQQMLAPLFRLDRKYLLIALLCLGMILIIAGLFMSLRHKKESVFPVTKSAPSSPAPSASSPSVVREPAAHSEPEPVPAPADQAVIAPGKQPKTSLKKSVMKKKTRPARKPQAGRQSRERVEREEPEGMGEWVIDK
jgi:serine/threonine protein kinase